MAQKKNTAEKKKSIWSTAKILESNLDRAKKLCPEGYIFQYWFNELISERLKEEESLRKSKKKAV